MVAGPNATVDLVGRTGSEAASRVGSGISAGAGYVGSMLSKATSMLSRQSPDEKECNMNLERDIANLEKAIHENEVEENEWVLIEQEKNNGGDQ